MKTKFLFLLFLLLSARLSGQQVISSAGTHATGTGVQLSWTLGETVVSTLSGSSVILTQGLHQGKLTITVVDPVLLFDVTVTAFPNPVNDKLNIGFSNFASGQYTISVTDNNNRLIFKNNAIENPQPIDMTTLSSGIYFLKVEAVKSKLKQVFKIVKQ